MKFAGASYVLGVFDGLGGAGANTYDTAEGVQTGARIAANICSKAVEKWATEDQEPHSVDTLARALRSSLDDISNTLPASDTTIRGSILQRLPSTIALAKIEPKSDVSRMIALEAIWAGDSRVYILSPERGLLQITKDHTKRDVDAQENLQSDAPLKNNASAGQPFYLETNTTVLYYKCIVITATDGCFGYVSSPIFFEKMLLDSIVNSSSVELFREHLGESIASQSSDDASSSMIALGWDNWDQLRGDFLGRSEFVKELVVAYEGVSREAELLSKNAMDAAERQEETLKKLWNEYRITYESTLESSRVEVP